jgi:hypothetical protein
MQTEFQKITAIDHSMVANLVRGAPTIVAPGSYEYQFNGGKPCQRRTDDCCSQKLRIPIQWWQTLQAFGQAFLSAAEKVYPSHLNDFHLEQESPKLGSVYEVESTHLPLKPGVHFLQAAGQYFSRSALNF